MAGSLSSSGYYRDLNQLAYWINEVSKDQNTFIITIENHQKKIDKVFALWESNEKKRTSRKKINKMNTQKEKMKKRKEWHRNHRKKKHTHAVTTPYMYKTGAIETERHSNPHIKWQ